MSKIGTSNDFFKTHAGTLQKRQPSGAASKREATSLDLAAKRLRQDGTRRGFETVYDNIVERDTIYCKNCGSANVGDAAECKLCFVSSFFKGDKLTLTHAACGLPFHTAERRPLPPSENKAAFPLRVPVAKFGRVNGKLQKIGVQTPADIARGEYEKRLAAFEELTCRCFDAKKAARRAELSAKSTVKRCEKNAAIGAARIKTRAAARLTELEKRLAAGGLSHAEKKMLGKQRVELLKVLHPIK